MNNVNVQLNVNISTNCANNPNCANFGQPAPKKPKMYQNRSISIVKEVDESKEVSCIDEPRSIKKEESKRPKKSNERSSQSDPELEENAFMKAIKASRTKKPSSKCMIKESISKIETTYNFIGVIGEGGYGKVLKIETKDSKQVRACKVQSKDNIKNSALDMVRNEIEILKVTDHPNIVRVYEFTEDEKNFNIVMEYCRGGQLFEYITKKGTFTEGMA